MRTAFCLSLACNGVLAAALVAAPLIDPRGASRTVSAASAALAPPGSAARRRDPGPELRFAAGPLEAPSFYRELRARGFAHDETKPLLLEHLRRAHDAEPPRPVAYWQPRASAIAERRLAALAADEPIRAALRAVYGVGAEKDPAFAALFQPLADTLPFLSSQAQLAVLRTRLAHEAELAATAAACARRAAAARCGDAPARGGELEGLAEALDAGTLFEIGVRESALAAELRSAGLGFSEAEFRETYAIFAALEARGGAADIGAARHALRAALGDARFDRLWASRDPVFAAVERVLGELGHTADQTLAAYGVMNRTQDALIDAAEAAAVDPRRGADLARAALAGERAQLGGLVEPRAAEKLLEERSSVLANLARNR
jgi:hypothetical protein